MNKIIMHDTSCLCPVYRSFWTDVVDIEHLHYEKHWVFKDDKIPTNRPLNFIGRFYDTQDNLWFGLIEDPMSYQVWIIRLTNYDNSSYFTIYDNDNGYPKVYNSIDDIDEPKSSESKCKKIIKYVVEDTINGTKVDVEFDNVYEALLNYDLNECLDMLGQDDCYFPIERFNEQMSDVSPLGIIRMSSQYNDEDYFYYDGKVISYYNKKDLIYLLLRTYNYNMPELNAFAEEVFN